jgi:hypothetical protein
MLNMKMQNKDKLDSLTMKKLKIERPVPAEGRKPPYGISVVVWAVNDPTYGSPGSCEPAFAGQSPVKRPIPWMYVFYLHGFMKNPTEILLYFVDVLE